MTVTDHATGAVIRSQRGTTRRQRRASGTTAAEAPRGASSHLTAYPRHAYAGTLRRSDLRGGDTRRSSASIVSRHRFRAQFVESRWSLVPDGNRHAHSVRLTFPVLGRRHHHGRACATEAAGQVGSARIALHECRGSTWRAPTAVT